MPRKAERDNAAFNRETILRKALHWLAGIALLPVCVVVTRTLWRLVESLSDSSWVFPPGMLALAGGFLLWVVLFMVAPRPVRTYVLAHELTHALWGALMGAKVSKLRVEADRGSVMLSKTNVLITLAPYFFPFYMMLVVVLYYLLSIWYDVAVYSAVWLSLLGFTWGFHCTFTIHALLQRQTDIAEYGKLFSYALIYTMNITGICVLVVMISSCTLEQFMKESAGSTRWVAVHGGKTVAFVWARGAEWVVRKRQ